MVSNSLLKSAKKISTRIINLSLVSIIGLSSLVVATPLLFSASAYATTPPVYTVIDTTTTATYPDIQSAIDAATGPDTITLTSDATITTQININKAITLDGQGFHLYATFARTSSSNNAAIGITHSGVNIKNLIEDGTGSTSLHGINVYVASNVTLDNITVSHNGHAGMVVNGSTVTATNFNASYNVWGSVNVDPGLGVMATSGFTLNSGSLGDARQIWSDGSYVDVSAIVAVNAPGYRMYNVGGTITVYFWSNRELTNAATITRSGATTWYAHIQNAITDAISGDTISVGAGSYSENLYITKSLNLVGAGQASTTIYPAFSNPTGANNVITIQADNVNLHDFTIDGANPLLVGGVSLGGASVNANRGIMTDPSQNHTNIAIHDVTVKNIYLRGIQLGGSISTPSFFFSITHNTVQNIQGDNNSSIAIFNRGGAGEISNNNVSGTPDAISANNSRGTQFLNNVITSSASGIHTDNAGGSGGTSDLIQGNQISNGVGDGLTGYPVTGSFGIWVYSPYTQTTVDNNTITNVKNGLASFGQGAAVTTMFTNNHLNLNHIVGSLGALLSTDVPFSNQTDMSASFTGNTISNAETGFYVESPGSKTATVTAHYNTITGFTTAYNNNSSTTQDAMNNYWGFTSPNFLSIIHGVVTHNPWYADAAMTIPATASALGGSTPTMTFGVVPPMAITTSSGIVKVDIPTGLTVTGPAGWDGIVSLPVPTLTFVITPDPGHTFTPIEAISIGAGDTHLTLDQPVKLDFVNQAGKQAGWSQAGVFHKITAVCDPATAPTLSLGADCKINVGADLIVWTKHFTAFVVYTDTTTADTTTTTQNYVVIAGDTLSDIGIKFGVDWNLIANYNGIDAPYTIYPGQVLKLVTSNVVTPVVVTAPTEATPTPGKVLGDSISPQIGTAASTVASKPASTFKAKWYYLVVAVVLASVIYFAYKRSKKSSKEV